VQGGRPEDGTITLYEWILNEFTVDSANQARARESMGRELAALIQPGDRVLDLCCGAGAWSFFLEERGAAVRGVDFAPYMIEPARKEAARRGSRLDFVLGDVLADDLGEDQYDLTVLMGNTVADFPPQVFSRLVEKVYRALKANGRFAVHYIDGIVAFESIRYPGEGIQQEGPVQVTWRYETYSPEEGATIVIYINQATGEQYEYTSYLYTAPLVRLLMSPLFTLEVSHRPSERSFLDIYAKSEAVGAP
jgi:SAM-dependent methyltransferase